MKDWENVTEVFAVVGIALSIVAVAYGLASI